MTALILYEHARSGNGDFGPHELLISLVESLIQAIKDRDEPPSLSLEQLVAALAKDVNARDMILTRVARLPGGRNLRDCIRKRVPSIETAIAFIVSRIAA